MLGGRGSQDILLSHVGVRAFMHKQVGIASQCEHAFIFESSRSIARVTENAEFATWPVKWWRHQNMTVW